MVPTMSDAPPVPWHDLAHREAQAALEGGAPVFVPVNPVEYHGPHLSLQNDALITAGLMQDLQRALGEPGLPLHTPDLGVGVDPVPGPGTRAVPYATVVRLVRDACRAVADLGARRVVLLTFHGSPLHNVALEAGLRVLRRRGVTAVAPFNAVLNRLIRGGEAGDLARLRSIADAHDPAVRNAMEAWGAKDYHAGLMETSLALHYAPHTVAPDRAALPPCPPPTPHPALRAASRAAAACGRSGLAAELDFAAFGLGWFGLRPFPAYTGHPGLASASLGAAFAELVVEILVTAVQAVFEGRATSPSPPLAWLRTVTLGGRLPASGPR